MSQIKQASLAPDANCFQSQENHQLVDKNPLKAWLKALAVIFPSSERHFEPKSAPPILNLQAITPKPTLPVAA